MQAIILAAGMGKRLQELTKNNTKCMVEVNGVTLIERALRQLDGLQLSRIVLVVGYEREKLMDFVLSLGIGTPVVFVENPVYDRTNNIYSLYLARDYLVQEDTLLMESDLIFDREILTDLLEDDRDTLAAVAKFESWMDGTCFKVDENDSIVAFIPGKQLKYEEKSQYYKTVNIYKFGKAFSENFYVPFLEAYIRAMGNDEYYESVLRVIALIDRQGIQARRIEGRCWYEIDDIQDLDIACSLFASDEKEKMQLVQKRFGGFWRYPKMLDFCYLVNPYFPSEHMISEMKANFESLLTQYPSGMYVNSLLAARNFRVRQEHIVVGNGAAELIKMLMDSIRGKVGIVRPTFEEYPNRLDAKETVAFVPKTPGYGYSAQELSDFFEKQDIEALVLINPDNPTGNDVGKKGLEHLLAWSKNKGILLIVDESFADFADEELSLLSERALTEYPNLVVVKSISKSYGVPGIRLGVLASADRERIGGLKQEAPIWNINSFGEFFMQILEKYRGEYQNSLQKVKEERGRFSKELAAFEQLTVYPSSANYLMVETKEGLTASDLAEKLLKQADLLVKDLSGKTAGREFLRIAVRTKEDDDRLLEALRLAGVH